MRLPTIAVLLACIAGAACDTVPRGTATPEGGTLASPDPADDTLFSEEDLLRDGNEPPPASGAPSVEDE